MKNVAAIALLMVGLSGCASLMHTFDSDVTNKVYIGTKKDWKSITEDGCGGATFVCEGVNPIVDLPLSAVMDTLLLPYTLMHQLTQGEPEKKPPPEPLVAQHTP